MCIRDRYYFNRKSVFFQILLPIGFSLPPKDVYKRQVYGVRRMERIDDLQYKGLRLIQDSELFSFGTDAVLLAGFCDVGRRDRVLDMGTGTGILPVLLSAKNPEALLAVELQTAAADLARRNMELNGICCDVVTGDMREAYKIFSGGTAVVCNPPYDKVGSCLLYTSRCV